MKQSQFFIKTLKKISTEEKSINAQLLLQGGFIDRLMAGVYTFLPLGLRVLRKIEKIIRQELEKEGAIEILMPALHPKENWLITGRWDTFDALYKLKDHNIALGPTHEEVLVPLVKKRIHSYKDLPLYLYQIQNKFRNEKRAKSGLLRGREFLMKDLYSFHTTQEDLDNYYERIKQAYFRIFERCGLKKQTYLTFASGGSFSKFSHEFQVVTQAGEDKIYICQKCSFAINKEILRQVNNVCKECGSGNLIEAKAIEVGNIFKLGTKFSEPFDLKYRDSLGQEKYVVMGCYGIGLPRVMGAIVEVWHDPKGIIWPREVSPFLVHLLAIGKNQKVFKEAQKLYHLLLTKGIEVLYDERYDISPGEKFAEADLIGCPFRLVVSEKTIAKKKFELKKSSEDKIRLLSGDKVILSILK